MSAYEKFLKSVPLQEYREKYIHIKTVEMDLPRNIQALKTIYEQYWQNADNLSAPLCFDDYYLLYCKTHEKDINEFWGKTGFGKDCDCFKKGLEARIYRTWASLITQIQGGYVAESLYGKNSVKMGTELDHQDIDILITKADGREIKVQIKKESHRPEIARMQAGRSSDQVSDVYYIVPGDYESPIYKVGGKKGQLKPWAKEFIKFNPDNGTLDRLDNGFVIFTRRAFQDIG
ncbi:MAG: TaqI family restriction endonuclease [Proteobacteria bacterium]|nr:TaqI family restriction endonuclease [Pseudomonadota bacterium]